MMMMVYNLSSMQPSTVYTDTELIYYLYNLMKYIQLKITSFAITIHKKNRTIFSLLLFTVPLEQRISKLKKFLTICLY